MRLLRICNVGPIDNVDIDKGEDFAIKILKLIRRTV